MLYDILQVCYSHADVARATFFIAMCDIWRFFVLEGNIAGYWCDINTVRVIKRTAKGDDEGCSH